MNNQEFNEIQNTIGGQLNENPLQQFDQDQYKQFLNYQQQSDPLQQNQSPITVGTVPQFPSLLPNLQSNNSINITNSQNLCRNDDFCSQTEDENDTKMVVEVEKKKPRGRPKNQATNNSNRNRSKSKNKDKHGILNDYSKKRGRGSVVGRMTQGENLARLSEIDLINNPNLTRQSMAEQQQDESSALINQINSLNLSKKQQKTKQSNRIPKQPIRNQPTREVKGCQKKGGLFSQSKNISSSQIIQGTKPRDQGRETCPQNLEQQLGRLTMGQQDMDRDMIQSQVVEGTQAPPITEKERLRLEEEEKMANDPYYEMHIPENDEDEDIQCDVCLEYEYEDDDQIVICEMCNVGVHQSCYGGDILEKIPKDDWFCERCIVLKNNKALKCRDINCFLCDEVQGAMKQTDQKNNVWAHAICINWTPQIYFTDEWKNKINGELDLERFNLTCKRCIKRNQGSCIQCDYKNCTNSKHVRCAVADGMIFQWDKMEQMICKNYITDGDYDMPVFCEKHRIMGSLAYREGGIDSLKPKETKLKKPLTTQQKRNVQARINKRKQEHTIQLTGHGISQIKNLVDQKFKGGLVKKKQTRQISGRTSRKTRNSVQKEKVIKKQKGGRKNIRIQALEKKRNQKGLKTSNLSKKILVGIKSNLSSQKGKKCKKQPVKSKNGRVRYFKNEKAGRGRTRSQCKNTNEDLDSSEDIEMELDQTSQPQLKTKTKTKNKKTKKSAKNNLPSADSFDISKLHPNHMMELYGQWKSMNQPQSNQSTMKSQKDITKMIQMYQQYAQQGPQLSQQLLQQSQPQSLSHSQPVQQNVQPLQNIPPQITRAKGRTPAQNIQTNLGGQSATPDMQNLMNQFLHYQQQQNAANLVTGPTTNLPGMGIGSGGAFNYQMQNMMKNIQR